MFAVGEARLSGKVIDTDGKPIEGATITVTSATTAKTFKQTFKTNAKGEIAIFLIDGTIPYNFTFEKEGYAPYTEEIKLKLVPEKNIREIKLGKGQAQQVVSQTQAVDPAAVAYNEGVSAWNGGDTPAAIAKWEEALTIKADLTAANIALAKAYFKTKNWDKAIENGTKALDIDADQPDINAIMADAWAAKGDKAKAAEYRKKAPANPTTLFNEAARSINAGKDAEAEPLLKQAIEADATFAIAYYELGMVQARLGKNADAKANLNKYIELEPAGKDVATAKEMIKYLPK
jgi:tetratricopeptide (TPR) repeat protein